jgi:hypothetical protein
MKLPEYKAILQGEAYNSPGAAARFMAAGKRNLASDPVGIVWRGLVNVTYIWLTPMTMRFVPSRALNGALTLVRLALWVLAVVGGVAACRRGQKYAVAAIALVFLYVTAALVLLLAMHRLVTPFVPALFPLAAVGVRQLWTSRQQRMREAAGPECT